MMPHSLTRQRLSKAHRRITRPHTGDLMPGDNQGIGRDRGRSGDPRGGTIIALEWTKNSSSTKDGRLVLVLQLL